MRRLIRHSFWIALSIAATLVSSACKREESPAPQSEAAPQETAAPVLVSTINAADPRAKAQLVRGFHDVEAGAWRWTMGKFSAVLRTPTGSARNGASLQFKFTIPAVSIERLKSITLRAAVNGFALPAQTYTEQGSFLYSQDVPASALAADAVTVDFMLDKFMPPTSRDARELGVIAQRIGLVAR
jgi:hypothetical protein